MTFAGSGTRGLSAKQTLGRGAILGGDQSQLAQQFGIDQRNPHLERMRHAGPIGVAQQLIAHVERRFQHGDLAKAGPRLRFQPSFDVPKRVEAT